MNRRHRRQKSVRARSIPALAGSTDRAPISCFPVLRSARSQAPKFAWQEYGLETRQGALTFPESDNFIGIGSYWLRLCKHEIISIFRADSGCGSGQIAPN